jgi:hypothetical protein
MSNRTCCVCTEPGKPIQIHHIDENPSNNVLENLAILCLHCHEDTQISGGFGRKLDAAQTSKFREQWLIRVNFRRHKADEDSIKAVTHKNHTTQTAIPLRDYIPLLPEFLKRAYDNAREGWEGTTADMMNSSYYVADVLEGILVYLSNFYPDGHFDQRDPRDYISELVSTRYSWHRHHMEPNGGGSGGTMIGPMVAMNVITDLRAMVDEMVSSLSDNPSNHFKFNFLQWRTNWRSAAGDTNRISTELTHEGKLLLKTASVGEIGSITSIAKRPANVFWMAHDLTLAIHLAKQEPLDRNELRKNLVFGLRHLDEVGLQAVAARSFLLRALAMVTSKANLSEEKLQQLIRDISRAKNELVTNA